MVMDSDKVAQSFVNYHEGYIVRHPLEQESNECNKNALYPVELISGTSVALCADLVRDIGGMTFFPVPLPISSEYATFHV